MHYAVCPRCGTTTVLTSSNSKIRWGKCKNCGNKVVNEK